LKSLLRNTYAVLLGLFDLLDPRVRGSLGSPLNGQRRRSEIVIEMSTSLDFDRALETGTYRGSSTRFLSDVVGGPVTTVESNPRFYVFSRLRLYLEPAVRMVLGDSRAFLRDEAAKPAAASETILIYLDSHWHDDLPLREELQIIAKAWPRGVVMIDDFQVPGDPGYGYDDYGPGKVLNEDYLPAADLGGWQLLWPKASSDEETGHKRGTAILAGPDVASTLAGLDSLRPGRSF
jgi:hypothetical protein